jgi:hypothetical protein
MSKSVEKASHEAQDEAPLDSVYDFLYHDSRRIGSFLSQFDNNGLLTGLNRGETSSLGSKRGWKFGAGGDLPLLGGANVSVEREPSESGSETLQRSYDPFWINALTLLDFLTERGLIKPEIEEAALGQFVLVRGWLNILDLAMFKEAWRLPTVQQAVRFGEQAALPVEANGRERRSQGRQSHNRATMPSDADITLELLTVLPHTVHASIITEYATVWANLREEFMVTPSSELALTHGTSPPGDWALLGILSGRPDIGESEHQQLMAQMGSDLPPGLVNSAIGLMAKFLTPLIRTALGRPANAFAVTPLLIFREVT